MLRQKADHFETNYLLFNLFEDVTNEAATLLRIKQFPASNRGFCGPRGTRRRVNNVVVVDVVDVVVKKHSKEKKIKLKCLRRGARPTG